jgi:hypothetical protein
MDISLTPDLYTPSVDENGNYVDIIPVIRHGIICSCGSRADKSYENATKFSAHTKTKKHKKWLLILNQNKANHYVEMIQCKELVNGQQQIITRLENQLQSLNLTIEYLTEQLTKTKNINSNECIDLLDIN